MSVSIEVNIACNVSILYVSVPASIFECVRQISTAALVSVDQQYVIELLIFISVPHTVHPWSNTYKYRNV